MTLSEIFTITRTAGIVLQARGETLHVEAPPGTVTPALRAALVALKPDLLALLERVQAMRRLATVAPLAVPYVRPLAKGGPGHCFSCGDALDHPDAYGRCAPCDVALELYYTMRHAGQDVEVVA